jgi:oligopeptide transport system permease protein
MTQLFDPVSKAEIDAIVKKKTKANNFSLSRNKKLIIGGIIFGVILLLAIFGPIFSKYKYDELYLEKRNTPPSKEFLFGSDELGRDIFTRVCYGGRISLTIGLFATVIDLIIGVLYGTTAGFLGNKIDELMMRICDTLYAIPYLLYVIVLTVIFYPGFFTILLALTITGWINMARIVRSEILKIKAQEFILAATAIGASKKRIILTHLIPNVASTVVTTVILTMSQAIFAEAFLSFLGLGIQAPVPSWGIMICDGISALYYYPWRIFFPAISITLTILSCNLIGESLKKAFRVS